MRRTLFQPGVAVVTFIIGVGSAYVGWFALSGRSTLLPEIIQVRPSRLALSEFTPKARTRRATTIEQEWEELTTATFCFLGSQDYYPPRDFETSESRRIGETSFNPYGWLPAIRNDKRAAVAFLINQIPVRAKTHAHICPFDSAWKGELAIYCLQHILKINWYELDGEYRRRLDSLNIDYSTRQSLLRSIIRSKRGAKEMMRRWMERYEATAFTEE